MVPPARCSQPTFLRPCTAKATLRRNASPRPAPSVNPARRKPCDVRIVMDRCRDTAVDEEVVRHIVRIPPVRGIEDFVRDAVPDGDPVGHVRDEGMAAAVPGDDALDDASMRPVMAMVEVEPVASQDALGVLSRGLPRTQVSEGRMLDGLRLRRADEDVRAAAGGPFDPNVPREVQHLGAAVAEGRHCIALREVARREVVRADGCHDQVVTYRSQVGDVPVRFQACFFVPSMSARRRPTTHRPTSESIGSRPPPTNADSSTFTNRRTCSTPGSGRISSRPRTTRFPLSSSVVSTEGSNRSVSPGGYIRRAGAALAPRIVPRGTRDCRDTGRESCRRDCGGRWARADDDESGARGDGTEDMTTGERR